MSENKRPGGKSEQTAGASTERGAEAPDDRKEEPLPDGEVIAEVGDALGGPA